MNHTSPSTSRSIRCAMQQIGFLLLTLATMSPVLRAAEKVSSPLELLAQEDVKKSRAIGKTSGAMLGAAIGWAVGNKNANNDAQKALYILGGATLGTLIGDQLGKAVGETISRRRMEYGREQAFLESEIQAANSAISMRERKLVETEKEIRGREAKIAQLEKSTQLTRAELQQAKAELDAVKKRLEENTVLLQEYKGALAYLDETLKTSTPEATAAEAEKALWAEKKKTLELKRAELVAQSDRLLGVEASLKSAESRLALIVKK